MARRPSPDPTIGKRIETRRKLRGWSIRLAADRAGISHSTWSRIERGLLSADNRFTLADIATALECSTTDLTGLPQVPDDRQLETAHARVNGLRRALVEIAPDEPAGGPALPVEQLSERMELLASRRRLCDYAGVGQLLPDLLLSLHRSASGPDARQVLGLLVAATYAATFTLRHLGYVAEATLAAERCRQAAERLDQPVPLAVADWVRAHAATAAGSYRRSLTLVGRAGDELDQHLDAPEALEVRGMLHLTFALSLLGEHRPDDARSNLREAERIAGHTGETRSWSMSFGPTNVAIWRVGLEVDAGEPGRAVELARATTATRVPSKGRQASYYVDLGRSLARLRQDQEAIRFLLTAERTAPQRVRSSATVRETARALLDRSRREAGGSALRGLCERVGVAL